MVPQFVGVQAGSSGNSSPADPMANNLLKLGNTPSWENRCTWHNCSPSIPTRITRLIFLDMVSFPLQNTTATFFGVPKTLPDSVSVVFGENCDMFKIVHFRPFSLIFQ